MKLVRLGDDGSMSEICSTLACPAETQSSNFGREHCHHNGKRITLICALFKGYMYYTLHKAYWPALAISIRIA